MTLTSKPKGAGRDQAQRGDSAQRLNVNKTYKLFIDGKFPRTESGRFDTATLHDGSTVNYCRASRKDFRNAVVAARGAFPGWAARSAFNRGQILYRIAEMLEGRAEQFHTELLSLHESSEAASLDVARAIDRLVYFAGWTDKIQQVFSSVNPVSSSHFNFSIVEPVGVVAGGVPRDTGLLGLVSAIAPILAGGNSCVLLASDKACLSAITFAEVLHSSDVPSGVVNLLTGRSDELQSHMASHMDVDSLLLPERNAEIELLAIENLKRVRFLQRTAVLKDSFENPYQVREFLETKTTWHPIGR